MTRIYAIAAVTAIAGLLGATWWFAFGRGGDVFAGCRASVIAGGAGTIGGPFTLVNSRGEPVTDADVITKPSLVYFGYTFCPDVCPLDNSRNADAVDLLVERGYDIQPVFITIDPERDTPEVMADYIDFMHSEMIGLTGTPDQIKAASQAYKTLYSKQDSDDPEFYLMNHSNFTYLMMPEHGFVEFFRAAPSDVRPGLEAEPMADQVACFLDAV